VPSVLTAGSTITLKPVASKGERGSPTFEAAAMRWLERYLVEGMPRLQHFAEITASLASRDVFEFP
jgi:hypothetical protein